jgi:hypothetical protein
VHSLSAAKDERFSYWRCYSAMSLSQLNAQARASEYRGRATHMALAYMSSSARNGSSSNSAWLKVEIEGGDTYGIAMQTTPGRFTYSRTDAAPVARDCFQCWNGIAHPCLPLWRPSRVGHPTGQDHSRNSSVQRYTVISSAACASLCIRMLSGFDFSSRFQMHPD